MIVDLRSDTVTRPSVGMRLPRSSSRAKGLTVPDGCEPAEYALKRPPPAWRRIDSAMMLRAELPVQRNSTL